MVGIKKQPKAKIPAASPRPAREDTKKIQEFIVASVESHPSDLVAVVATKFDITRQAVNRHLNKLIDEGVLQADGKTKSRSYKLSQLFWSGSYAIVPGLAEHDVWDKDIFPMVADFPKNVRDIWQFSFTEMFNNAVDHSGGSKITVYSTKTAVRTEIIVGDDGIGIFKKIQSGMDLADERVAILELSKGKLTTDPDKHTGQGIFFTSRLLDLFVVFSGGLAFRHDASQARDWLLESATAGPGTRVLMSLRNNSDRLDENVFKKFSSEDGAAFSKTVVPVTLARFGQEKLVSRSQAKVLLARVDRFETVMLDFTGVETIGQAFADEIFRVFARSHPKISIFEINTNESIDRQILAARKG